MSLPYNFLLCHLRSHVKTATSRSYSSLNGPYSAFDPRAVRLYSQFAQQYPTRFHHGLAGVIVIVLRLTLAPGKRLPAYFHHMKAEMTLSSLPVI